MRTSGFAAPGDSAVGGLGSGEEVSCVVRDQGCFSLCPSLPCRGVSGDKVKKWVLLAGAHPFGVWVRCQ